MPCALDGVRRGGRTLSIPGPARPQRPVAIPVLVLLAALACAHARARTDAPVPLAYEIVAPSGHRAFVLGSIHVERAGASGLHPMVLEAFERSPLLVLEVDLSALDPGELYELMLEMGRLPEGESLRGRVSVDTWELLRQHCEREGCLLEELESRKPWLVALQLVGDALSAQGFEAEHGVERRILAGTGTKEIIGLERPREQFELFDQLPPEQQELMLRDALAPSGTSADELEELVAAWRLGDGPTLESLLFRHLDERPELELFYEATFFRRNELMARGLATILEQTPYVFVVLGAGHLLGARGVPALLERSGYRVRQVRAPRSGAGASRLRRDARTASGAHGGPRASRPWRP